MHALLRRFTDQASDLTGQYSKDFSKKTSALTERAGELSESALAQLDYYRERAREKANRAYSAAMDHPKTTATVLGIVAVGVVAAGIYGILRYREQRRLAMARSRGAAQRARGKRVKAGQAASAA